MERLPLPESLVAQARAYAGGEATPAEPRDAATVVLLFGFQAGTIIAKPLVIAMIAIPLIIQSYGIFAISFVGAKVLRLPHNIAGPACLIGTSNFFELAVAVAISLFGLNSGAALATVVGVLVEVPVMLSLVAIINRTQHWFPGQTSAATNTP